MNNTELSLTVPSDNRLRNDIRQKVESFVSDNKILPPVSYGKLTELAGEIIEKHDLDTRYKAFIMVCCGNAVWRQVVGSVPFNRRMFLLPQCLKNSHLCKGKYDELGLLCAGCGNCSISDLLAEAENLGYLTIVSEGTTIATRLVERGNVDAIIGVGCMEVLRQMFGSVSKFSIPAIGIPLLNCGCVDTMADTGWISGELKHLNHNHGFKLLNINSLKEKTKVIFTSEETDRLLHLEHSATDNMIREMLMAGGKRIRPMLTILAYEATCSNPDTEVLKRLALSVECFHKASLVHDDIEDNDAERYGKETLHAKYGLPVAVNAGDLLIGEGYRLLSECRLEPEILISCLKVISEGHRIMARGQNTELLARRNKSILPVSEILEIFRYKTAEAFKVSLLTGALAGRAGNKSLDILSHFCHYTGLAYQIKDDIEDLTENKASNTLTNPSILISIMNEIATQKDRIALQEAIKKDEYGEIRLLIEKYPVVELASDMLRMHLEQAFSSIGELRNISLKLALHEITGKTFRDYA